ncbi:hypothetical protein ZEAMMB73_Zm00001d024954 [Zea mays]|uniref:Uncharacterized protein n=1 Tax=Zea mays TaxID=4577 RepID=K7UH38_MAIZE|nr:hypothetical protein ZEAMMB73_Zm00001d024954 [Zea mays]
MAVPGKTSWPELVGSEIEQAVDTICVERTDVNVICEIQDGQPASTEVSTTISPVTGEGPPVIVYITYVIDDQVLSGAIMSLEIGEQYLTDLWMVPNIGLETF